MDPIVKYYGSSKQPAVSKKLSKKDFETGTAMDLPPDPRKQLTTIADEPTAPVVPNASCVKKTRTTHTFPVKKKITRPSLSEQLASIGAAAEEITKGIHDRLGEGPPGGARVAPHTKLCSVPVSSFAVGTLTCRYPSPIHFYDDRCEFQFHHPYENTVVSMTMFFRDMTAISLRGSRFSFNIPRELLHFKVDYDPRIHCVVIEFLGCTAVENILLKVGLLREIVSCRGNQNKKNVS